MFGGHCSLRPSLLQSTSLLDANAVLGGWHLGVGGVEANGLTGVGGGLVLVWWGSTIVSGGGGSGIGEGGVLTADSG